MSQGLGSRIAIAAGDVLADDLGEAEYDLVFMSMLVHHFDRDQNLAVARKVRRALRRGGVFVIQDIERTREPSEKNQLGGLMDLYFALISRSGTWSMEEMTEWLRTAGFEVGRPVRFRTSPGLAQAVGKVR